MAIASTEFPVLQAAASPEDLREAFRLFTEATASFTATYEALNSRVQQLDLQLGETNAELQRNLAEKERVKDYLGAILEALPVGVVVVDDSGRVKTVNPAARQMLGIDETNAIGAPLDEALLRQGRRPCLCRSLMGGLSQGGRAEITLSGQEGESREVEVIRLPASCEQRSAFGGVIAFHDVTQMKRLDQRAATVSRLTAMGEMAMNVAHEIRNPLGSIELFSSALARDLADRPHQRRLAEHISAAVRSIESIVENILQFNRPRRLSRAEIVLAEVVRESLFYLSHLLEQRNVEVVWPGAAAEAERQAGPPCIAVLGDRELLKQVFLNLALNAAQAMETGGRLEIRLSRSAQEARVEFLDEGPGIPADLLPKIFDPFVTTKPKGTGLGLTIVHNIVTAHGGTIEISNRPARGARAAIELPLAPEGQRPGRPGSGGRPSSAQTATRQEA